VKTSTSFRKIRIRKDAQWTDLWDDKDTSETWDSKCLPDKPEVYSASEEAISVFKSTAQVVIPVRKENLSAKRLRKSRIAIVLRTRSQAGRGSPNAP
jgi:hypothetical protein